MLWYGPKYNKKKSRCPRLVGIFKKVTKNKFGNLKYLQSKKYFIVSILTAGFGSEDGKTLLDAISMQGYPYR